MKDNATKKTTLKEKLIYAALAVLGIALTVIGYVYLDTHRTYDWSGFDFGYSKQTSPRGAYYLKEFLKEEWEGEIIYDGYGVDYNEYLSDKKQKYNVLSFDYSAFEFNEETKKYDIVSDELNSIVSLLNKGNNFIFAADSEDLYTLLGLYSETNLIFAISDFDDKEHIPDSIGIMTMSDDTICHLWDNMISKYYTSRVKDNPYEKYLHNIPHRRVTTLLKNGEKPLCIRNQVGNGYATFVGSELLFSNYGVSREDTKQAIRYIIDNTFDKSLPLLVIFKDYEDIEQETDTSVERSNILDVLLANPGTNLAITILLITFLLTLLFNSRRRRRAEEERKRERNSSINYTKHLASLYDQTSDYKELLITEQRMLLYNLRKEYRFDISTHSFTRPSEFAPMIAKSKSLDQKQVADALRTLEYYTEKDGAINERLYIKCIEAIEFLRK